MLSDLIAVRLNNMITLITITECPLSRLIPSEEELFPERTVLFCGKNSTIKIIIEGMSHT